MNDLLIPHVVQKVPADLKYLACVLYHRRDHWNDNAALREQFMLEAHRDDYIDNVLSMLRATKHLVHSYLTGDMTLESMQTSVVPPSIPNLMHLHQYRNRQDLHQAHLLV